MVLNESASNNQHEATNNRAQMKTKWILTNLVAGLAIGGMAHAAEEWTTYNTRPGKGNLIFIEGTSTMHDWRVQGTIIGGKFLAGPGFPTDPATAKPGKVEAKTENVFIPVRALKSVKDDGTPVTSDDVHVVFYTVSEDGLVADLFLILGDFQGVTRFYDCETGEFQREERATDLTLLMQPVVYDPQTSRWQLGWRYDTVQQVVQGEIDPQSTIDVVLMAQGREP